MSDKQRFRDMPLAQQVTAVALVLGLGIPIALAWAWVVRALWELAFG